MFYFNKMFLITTLILSAPVFAVNTTEFKTTNLGLFGGLSYKDLVAELIATEHQGITYENVSIPYQFSPFSAGIFENGHDADLEFDRGIILSTGRIQYAKGPNECLDNTTLANNRSRSDAELEQLTTEQTFDVVALEFDLTPTHSHLEFNYIFASDEYSTNLADTFEDVFGFFLTDNTTGETINLAVVPGTSTPITTHSINANVNSQYYRDNHPIVRARRQDSSDRVEVATNSCSSEISQPTPFNLEFDGFTEVLTAQAEVIPQRSYHLKIVIADGKESKVDSAVFIQSQSLTSVLDDDMSDGGDNGRQAAPCTLYAIHDDQVNDSQFFKIDPDSHQVSAIGALHLGYDIEAVAVNPLAKTLYAASGKDAHSGPGTLYTVDMNNGQLTEIGIIKLDDGSAEGQLIKDISGLSFNPKTSTLWGWAQDQGLFLLEIDKLSSGAKAMLKWSNAREFGDITWNTQGNALYLADRHKLWYFDGTTEHEQPVCSWPNGEKVEALEMIPEGHPQAGYLLLGIDGDPVIHFMNLDTISGDGNQPCDVHSSYIETEYDDPEGMGWLCTLTP